MVFSGSIFIMIFLPAVFGLYSLCRGKNMRNILLTAASLLFYSFGEPFVVFIMVLSVLVNYVTGLAMDKTDENRRKILMILSVIWNIGLLGVYKYAGFFAEMINLLPFADIPVPEIHLPIGISFFTFQSMSYIIDLYRKKINVQKSFLKLLLYISFFPQLIAGPIVRYGDIESALDERSSDAVSTAEGIKLFIFGLSKKLLIADTLAVVSDFVFSLPHDKLSCAASWAGAVCYTLQIYFDFGGYSDMAVGLGKIFGFTFRGNFNYPYYSASMTEFWRRWHISLSEWFKEYLYIPLGGNRKGRTRTILNKWIVFLCTGLWHGANLTFLLWGVANGIFIMTESIFSSRLKKASEHRAVRALGHIYTIAAVTLCFAVFRSENIAQVKYFIPTMFGFTDLTASQAKISFSLLCENFTPLFFTVFITAVCFSLPVIPMIHKKISSCGDSAAKAECVVSYVISAGLFLLCLMSIAAGTYSPFIYFNF